MFIDRMRIVRRGRSGNQGLGNHSFHQSVDSLLVGSALGETTADLFTLELMIKVSS